MKHIRELLNQIRWDSRLNEKDFIIGYEDKIKKRIIEIPFASHRLNLQAKPAVSHLEVQFLGQKNLKKIGVLYIAPLLHELET